MSRSFAQRPPPSRFSKDLETAPGLSVDSDELDALQFGMDSERQAVEYYTNIMNMASDPEVKKIFAEIIEQEKSHFMILEEEFHHLKSAGFWYELGPLGQ